MVVSLLPLPVSVWLSPVPEARFSHSGHICDHPRTHVCVWGCSHGRVPGLCTRTMTGNHSFQETVNLTATDIN